MSFAVMTLKIVIENYTSKQAKDKLSLKHAVYW